MNAAHEPSVPTWEIFCQVVDNFGDIGVCWRLARDLAARTGAGVRLWVDDWAVLLRLCPAAGNIDPAVGGVIAGVELRQWAAPFPAVEPASVVIEAFACEIPETHLQAMARRQPAPVWINLEYLSAEDWVAGCHGMASPHPRLPLAKHFFFPGFGDGTGACCVSQGCWSAAPLSCATAAGVSNGLHAEACGARRATLACPCSPTSSRLCLPCCRPG